ncbi:MAG TPA: 4Fe-4S dicluster domain-containing protein [Anaerolineales bacterium]|nr:4Fe-4S dicluster domain-containing protein [Anaerolineales bacterium]
MSDAKLSRRAFLKVAAAAAAVAASLRAVKFATAAESAPGGGRQWVMVIDQNKCTGCGYCVMACRAHNDVPPNITWNPVLDAGEVAGKKVFLPRPCMQCTDAPCVEVCPVGASYHRPDGIVMMDYDRCIGCRYCEVACPYGARSFNWKQFTGPNPAVPEWGEPEVARRPRGVPEKCAFCYERIDRGLKLGLTPGVDQDATPACVVVCPTKARLFGDLNDPQSNVSQVLDQHSTFRLRENLGTDPHVYYMPAEADTLEG